MFCCHVLPCLPWLDTASHRFDYLPPGASLITSSADHQKKTKSQVNVHTSVTESTVSNQNFMVPKLITSREQILQANPDVLMV